MAALLAPESLGPTVTVGEILVEVMASEPGDGFLEPIALVGPYPSGAPAIFIDQVAKTGASAGIVAAVGDDDFGRLNVRRLAADGVDVSAITVSADRPTGSAFVRYRRDGGRDFVFNIAHSAAGEIARTAAVDALIARAGHVHVMGSALSMATAWPVLEAALSAVRARGGTVSFDPNLRKELLRGGEILERFRKVLAVTDLFLPSAEEIFLAAPGAADEAAAVAELLGRGIREIVVKHGAAGALRHAADGTVHRQPAFPVVEVDPTGAGDCFAGAYVASLRLGRPPEEALRLAAAAGARNVTRRGPMEGTSTMADLEAFVAASSGA